MSDTLSPSLLVRLLAQDSDAWRDLVNLARPLVLRWCRRAGLQEQDADDVCQDVFRALASGIIRFRREEGPFRAWLWGVTHNHLLAHHRRQRKQAVGQGGTTAQERFADLAEPAVEPPSAAEQADDRRLLLQRALEQVRGRVEERTWRAFWLVVEGQPPADVAAEMGMSVAAVYVLKGRVLGRLRAEFGDLLD